MKRATTLKVLAGTLVLILVASAFPLADVAMKAAEEKRAGEANAVQPAEGLLPDVDDLPFSGLEDILPPGPSGERGPAALDGASSRPDGERASQYRAGASGSVLLSQVLGAAEVMGHKGVAVPELPAVASKDPLRAAILTWIAATGSTVAPDELARELARADALPLDVQRDVALLLLSASQATLLQRAALAQLTPEEVAWIYENPQIGEALAQGIDTPETRLMAVLAGKVDMRKSVEATLLMLSAIEATRGSLSKERASAALDSLVSGELDATTRALLEVLASARADVSDQEKVLFAARLVGVATGLDVPAPGPAPSFDAALEALLAQTGQVPDASALATVKARASALPDDLEGAVARIVLAQANAVAAADPARLTPTSQQQALIGVLVAAAQALPVLEKYSLYWRGAPDALRVGEWEPSARLGWAAHHAALLVSARGDITDLASALPMLNGHAFALSPALPERSFTQAYVAVAEQGGFAVDDAMLAEIDAASAQLDPAVRDAAAVLLTGAAESARLQRAAYKHLTPEEQDFLRFGVSGLDALYTAPSLSAADTARLARATELASRVDAEKLAQAGVVAAMATAEAKRILDGRDAFQTQSLISHVATGLRGLLARLMPFGTAQAQDIEECNAVNFGRRLLETCIGDDVLLRVFYPTFITNGMTPAEWTAWTIMGQNSTTGDVEQTGNEPFFGPRAYTCDERECVVYRWFDSQVTHEMLVITGVQGRTYEPERTQRVVCNSVTKVHPVFRPQDIVPPPPGAAPPQPPTVTSYYPGKACRVDDVARYGAATVHLDLGGDDIYQQPVGMVHINATLPVSLFLDVGGADRYTDPSSLYDGLSPMLRDLGARAGHPTQASAVYGGVAIMLDAQGADWYDAPTRSQGFARLGFAMLADLGGDGDLYRGRDLVQGASSETFTLGTAILFDRAGEDQYSATSGQGFGLGAVLLDVGGRDIYRNDKDPYGIPIVHLDVLPGGDVTALDSRGDNLVWLDGHASLNVGLGIDQEALLSTGQSDEDGFPDVVEFIVGTDPHVTSDNPQTNPASRAVAVSVDSDGDGYPDYIERALSTDEDEASSYPAGFPTGLAVIVPSQVYQALPGIVTENLDMGGGRFAPFSENTATGDNFTSSDKVVDLRLPLQDAGTLDYGCTGEFYPNATAPMGINPGNNTFMQLPPELRVADEDPETGGPDRGDDGSVRQNCVYFSYTTTEPGAGNSSTTSTGDADGNGVADETRSDPFSFRLPAGILAIGDVVPTAYVADYFVVIDLGGADNFTNSAGGALLAQTRSTKDPPDQQAARTFVAPSVVVNVDVTAQTQDALDAGASAKDVYVNATRDFAHGSFFGVLLDTAGADVYVSNDGSQGALGGLLLDLDGWDSYTARDLSQGASLAAVSPGAVSADGTEQPKRPVGDLPNGGAVPTDGVGNTEVGAHRRTVPGILLDLGAHPKVSGMKQTFSARSHSQGFARGYAMIAGQTNAPAAIGILASLGDDDDRYTTIPGARFMQGVAGPDGVGILLDQKGADTYSARGVVSHGATISQGVHTNAGSRPSEPHPGAGVLVDLGGPDSYSWFDASKAMTKARPTRQDNLSVIRSESTSSGSVRVDGDLGVHLDTEKEGTAPLSALMGAGHGREAVTSSNATGFHVFMPTARLAIGADTSTVYDREFAFVVDLGGDNTFLHNAGGLVRDHVAQAAQGTTAVPGTATESYAVGANLFPVTLVLDAGRGASEFTSASSFAQGAGFFGIGVLADLGGHDRIRSVASYATNASSAWMPTPPIVDANIGGDWEGIPSRTIEMRSLADPGYSSEWTMRVANDNASLYIALAGKTSSADAQQRLKDVLSISLDMGRRQQEWDGDAQRTGIDQIRVRYDANTGACVREDWGFLHSGPNEADQRFVKDAGTAGGLQVACRFTADGSVFYEIRKDLVVGVPYDARDLGYCFDESAGFGYATNQPASPCVYPASELGLMIKFGDFGAGYYQPEEVSDFTWPPGSVDEDGRAGHLRTNDLSDEMRTWAAIGLAQHGEEGAAPTVPLPATLTQGAGLAGVGIVANLGPSIARSEFIAGDRSLGYGTFGGLGVVIDVAGPDRYVAGERALGAGEVHGVGLFVELEGNDNYDARDKALGWTTLVETERSTGAFLDLAGEDEYAYLPSETSQKAEQLRRPPNTEEDPRPLGQGNNVFWVQNSTAFGADYKVLDMARQLVANAALGILHNQTRTYFSVTEYDPNATGAEAPWGNGCTTRGVLMDGGPAHLADFRVRGQVCFVATVDVGYSDELRAARTAYDAGGVKDKTVEDFLTTYSDTTVGGTVDVHAVDFLVDGARVATTNATQRLNKTWTRWSAPVDLSELPDGVVRGRALPLFSAELEQDLGVWLFQDEVRNTNNETLSAPASRTLLIDNPPRPAIALEPAFTGRADATYSTRAIGAQQELVVDYTVNRDVGEDRYAQYNGWRPNKATSSIPCRAVPTLPEPDMQDIQLCDILPFYLGKDGEVITTIPGTDPVEQNPAKVQHEVFDSAQDAMVAHFTDVLGSSLRIYPNESFRLTIPSRTSLDPTQAYTTIVHVYLQREDGKTPTRGGSPWMLGFERETAPKLAAAQQADKIAQHYAAVKAVYDQVNGTAAQAAEDLKGNPLENNFRTVHSELCVSKEPIPVADQPWRPAACDQVDGRPGAAGLRTCGGAQFPFLVVQTLATAVDAAARQAAGRNAICHSYINNAIALGAEHGDEIGEHTTDAGEAVDGALTFVGQEMSNRGLDDPFTGGESLVNGIHYNDIWFDANTTLPDRDHCNTAGHCVTRGPDGSIVIPAGFKIGLRFGVESGTNCPGNLCGPLGQAFADAANDVVAAAELANDTAAPTGVDAFNPSCLPRPNPCVFPSFNNDQDPIHKDGKKTLTDQDERAWRGRLAAASPPAGFYFYKSGPPERQPRFEIRVPSEPSTDVMVTVEKPLATEPSLVLRSGGGLAGDVVGTPARTGGSIDRETYERAKETPHATWQVLPDAPRWTQNTIRYSGEELEDALYLVKVTAKDLGGQEVTTTRTLLVDSTPPVTTVETSKFAGKAAVSGGSIPVRWSVLEQGAGLSNVTLFYRLGEDGDVSDRSTWTQLPAAFPSTVRSYALPRSSSTNVYLLMTVGVDRAGNLEGLPPGDEIVPDFGVALQRAFDAKVGLGAVTGGFHRVFVDEGLPDFVDLNVTGGRVLSYQGSDFTFVRAGAPIAFSICALDEESEIDLVRLALDHVVPGSTAPPRSVTLEAKERGPCGESGTLFVADTWHEANRDESQHPEGMWIAKFEVFDDAGNSIGVPAGNVILDHRSPTVTLEAPILPPGQSAVKPGDVVKLRLLATDAFGVDERAIRVDASKFARNATALPTKGVRVNGVIYQEAQFTVDLPNLQNGVFNIAVSVPDNAGNVTVATTQLAVDFKPFEFVPGSLQVSNVTHNALTLRWKTDENTSSLAKFGTSSVAITGRTPQDLNVTKDHTLRVEGLQPNTRYYLRAVAVSAGGFTKESEIIEATTASALFLEALSPVSGGQVSGLVKVRFKGGLRDSGDFVSYTLEVRDGANASKPWTFLTTATRQGEVHELSWNSTRFLDATTYELRITAESGVGAAADKASIVIARLTSDNTPPSVLVLSPLLATNDTTPLLTAEASDALSGLRADPPQLLVDGEPAGNLSVERLAGGRIRVTRAFEEELPAGMRTFELRVSDRAGNVARETWKVAIDGDAPEVKVNPARFSPGISAAKRGGTVTFNLTIEDMSGVAHVVADTRALNAQATETRLVNLVKTSRWEGTVLVTAGDAAATKSIPIKAVDLAGNERIVHVDVPVDNIAPRVAATSLVDVKHRLAVIDVPADEPIVVNGTATAPRSPAVTAAALDARTTARIAFDGLLPSRTYQFQLTALDRAGNPVALAGSFATLQDTVPPSAVAPLSVLDLLNGTLRLSWPPATDDVLVSHYRVYRSDDGVTFMPVAETPATSYDDWGLPYEKPYVYRVAAVDHGANEGEASPSLRAAATAVPQLTVGLVTPTMGTTSTTFRYTVTYLSPGGIAPAYVRIILDGVPQNMSLESGTAKTGAVYVYETRLAPHTRDAPHTYAFEASDGRYTVSLPEDGAPMRGPLVSGDALAAGDVEGFAAFAQRVPLGGVAGLAIALFAAVGIAAFLRRKKEGSK